MLGFLPWGSLMLLALGRDDKGSGEEEVTLGTNPRKARGHVQVVD